MRWYALGKHSTETKSHEMYNTVQLPAAQLIGSPYAPSQLVTDSAPILPISALNPVAVDPTVTRAKI
jgi:hypothetical protein